MQISKFELQKIINPNLLRLLSKDQYEVQKVPAISLLTPNRFDLLAKYLYVKFKECNINSDFGYNTYLEHLKVFNGFYENDNSNKIGEEAFCASFQDVIDSLRTKGFNHNYPIPVSIDGSLIDGSHRVAASIYFKQDLTTVSLDIPHHSFNYEYFKNLGLSELYLDAMACEYANLKSNTFIIILWPSARGEKKELMKILNNYGEIVYKKAIHLINNGPLNLIRILYSNEPWLGSPANGYIGARNKAQWCFEGNGPVEIFLYESPKNILELKEKIRSLYAIGKHSVHINDLPEETSQLSSFLFNQNTIHWLNHASIQYFSWFNQLFTYYKEWVTKQEMPREYFCIDGSATLAAYGIREVRDLDFIHYGDILMQSGYREIGDHNKEVHYYNIHKDNIIFNPYHFFVLDKYKFVSLNTLAIMKQNRNEEKDKNDLSLIRKLMTTGKITVTLQEKLQYIRKLSWWKAKIKFLLLRIRFHIIKLYKKRL